MADNDQARNLWFGGGLLGTLVIGVGLALLAMHYFRTRALQPVQVPGPREVRNVGQPAPVPPSLTPSAPPLPTDNPEAVPLVWDGIWRRPNYPLPMFQFEQSGEAVAGTYVPNWAEICYFSGGKAAAGRVEFVVADQLFRVHFRLVMVGDDRAEAVGWVTDEDWFAAFGNANRKAMTPQQAALARLVLENMGRQTGKRISLGIFVRGQEAQAEVPSVAVLPVPVPVGVPVPSTVIQPVPTPVPTPLPTPVLPPQGAGIRRGIPVPRPKPPQVQPGARGGQRGGQHGR
jgi:hypothetical protein